jgi:hypothetical protein
VANAALLSTLIEGVGLRDLSTIVSVALIGSVAVAFGIVLTYTVHRWTSDRASWPAGMAVLVLVVPMVATQLSPTILAGSPGFPEVIEPDGGTHPLVEVIPEHERGGASVTVSAVDTSVGGELGIEGFITFVQATRDGEVVWDQRVLSAELRHSLPAGPYALEGYYRSCDGWCGLLDPPGPLCSVSALLERGQSYELVINVAARSCTLR